MHRRDSQGFVGITSYRRVPNHVALHWSGARVGVPRGLHLRISPQGTEQVGDHRPQGQNQTQGPGVSTVDLSMRRSVLVAIGINQRTQAV